MDDEVYDKETEDWLVQQGFEYRGLMGLCKLVPTMGDGDPVELCLTPAKDGNWEAGLVQSNRDDFVLITGRSFNGIQELQLLFAAVGLPLI